MTCLVQKEKRYEELLCDVGFAGKRAILRLAGGPYRDFMRSIDTLGTAANSGQIEEILQAFSVLLDSMRRRAYHEQMRWANEDDFLERSIESPSVAA